MSLHVGVRVFRFISLCANLNEPRETVMALLDAGFTPQALPVLRDKLKQIVRYKIKYRSQHFKYEVAHSGSAFVVPGKY